MWNCVSPPSAAYETALMEEVTASTHCLRLFLLLGDARTPLRLVIGEELRKDIRSIKEIVRFDDEELTEERIENKTRQTLRIIDKKFYQTALKHAHKLENTLRSKRRAYLRAKCASHPDVATGPLNRLHPMEKKRLIDKMRHTVEQLHSLECEVRTPAMLCSVFHR